MRLWHYKLIPFLPDSQLVAQWRELNSIFKNQPRHILINYVYEYPRNEDLLEYTCYVMNEMFARGFKVDKANAVIYFNSLFPNLTESGERAFQCQATPFKEHQTDRYLTQCFYNLQEKYDRGQKDFSKERYDRLLKAYRSYISKARKEKE